MRLLAGARNPPRLRDGSEAYLRVAECADGFIGATVLGRFRTQSRARVRAADLMAMSLFGFRNPDTTPWLVALVAATAATGGRVMLAHLAQRIARSRWVGPAMRDNLAVVAKMIERRRAASAVAFLLFAFSPLPSNVLFLAYGLTTAPLHLLAIPFFIGRVVSYAAAFAGGSAVSQHFESERSLTGSWLYFALSQLAMLAFVYAFTRVDWHKTRLDRRLRWLPRNAKAARPSASSVTAAQLPERRRTGAPDDPPSG